MVGTIICAIALPLILIGILYEEKLIAFEAKLWDIIADRIGYVLAQIYIKCRRFKVKVKKH